MLLNNFLIFLLSLITICKKNREGFFIGVGPKLAFNLSDEEKTFSKKSMVILAAANAGYQLPSGFRFAAFADLALTDMADLDNINIKNICAGVIVGFRL